MSNHASGNLPKVLLPNGLLRYLQGISTSILLVHDAGHAPCPNRSRSLCQRRSKSSCSRPSTGRCVGKLERGSWKRTGRRVSCSSPSQRLPRPDRKTYSDASPGTVHRSRYRTCWPAFRPKPRGAMRAIDTNVLERYLTGDEGERAAKARTAVETGAP